MTSEAPTLDLDLDCTYLEVASSVQERAWQTSQRLATPASRWRAYLNQMSLDTLLPWLEDEGVAARVQPMLAQSLLPTIWEWVSGTALDLNGSRLVVLPTDTIDVEEFRVPQEWIDCPAWIGDYYILVQINPDDGWLKLAGFATHQMLKTQGHYDWRDRTYSLQASDLILDLNVLWVSEMLNPSATKRTALNPLPTLAIAQAQQLIQRLSHVDILDPRLEIDFQSWGALMTHGGWRRQMAEERWGKPASFSVTQWFQSGVSQLAQQLGWQAVSFQAATVGARGDTDPNLQQGLTRSLLIQNESYLLNIFCIDDHTNAWRFELRKLNGIIPQGITLKLLTEDLQSFDNNQITATEPTESLSIDVALESEEGIVWEIEPTPSQYEPEILRF